MAIKQENRVHAVSAAKALQHIYGGVTERVITDMLSDIRHLCDDKGIDFCKIDRISYRKYEAEGGAQ